jgi:hypothetical protein
MYPQQTQYRLKRTSYDGVGVDMDKFRKWTRPSRELSVETSVFTMEKPRYSIAAFQYLLVLEYCKGIYTA